ncbi:MAG: tetratricopeptide repeat protein, partial [Candidatus Omnitrophota bacterium]
MHKIFIFLLILLLPVFSCYSKEIIRLEVKDGKLVRVREIVETYEEYFQEARQFIQKGLLDKALQSLQKAIEIDSNTAGAHNDLGVVYACKGDFDKAIEEFKKALENESNDYSPIIKYNLA